MSLAREKIKIAEALTPALPTPMGKTIARMPYSAMLETMYPHMNRPVTVVLALIRSRSSMTGKEGENRYAAGL
jgi:hypothetical protein